MKLPNDCYRLYAVTGRVGQEGVAALLRKVEAAVRGGVRIVQLREKHLDPAAFLAEARDFTALCRRLGAVSIINDCPEIALEAEADGVHVGQSDLEAGRVRQLLGPDKLLGVSLYLSYTLFLTMLQIVIFHVISERILATKLNLE